MIHVVPMSTSGGDLSLETTEVNEAACNTDSLPEDDCVLCELGCCIQRYRISADMNEAVVFHGVLGSA